MNVGIVIDGRKENLLSIKWVQPFCKFYFSLYENEPVWYLKKPGWNDLRKKVNHYQLHILLLLVPLFLIFLLYFRGFCLKIDKFWLIVWLVLLLLCVIWRVLSDMKWISLSVDFFSRERYLKKDEECFFKYKIDSLSSFIDY